MSGHGRTAPPDVPPTPTMQNLTIHTLRTKGVPEADIGAAINDPARMNELLNQLYGQRAVTSSEGAVSGFRGRIGADAPDDEQGQAAAPGSYLPFGWSGLPSFIR